MTAQVIDITARSLPAWRYYLLRETAAVCLQMQQLALGTHEDADLKKTLQYKAVRLERALIALPLRSVWYDNSTEQAFLDDLREVWCIAWDSHPQYLVELERWRHRVAQYYLPQTQGGAA